MILFYFYPRRAIILLFKSRSFDLCVGMLFTARRYEDGNVHRRERVINTLRVKAGKKAK